MNKSEDKEGNCAWDDLDINEYNKLARKNIKNSEKDDNLCRGLNSDSVIKWDFHRVDYILENIITIFFRVLSVKFITQHRR